MRAEHEHMPTDPLRSDPASPLAAEPGPRLSSNLAAPTAGLRLRALIAEDEYAYRVAIARMLAEIGIDSIGAEDGLAAAELLERVDEEPLHLAITDFRMPRASGFRVIEAARAFRGPSFPVVMQTGESQYADVYSRAHELGVPIIAKADLYTHLIPAVREALGLANLA